MELLCSDSVWSMLAGEHCQQWPDSPVFAMIFCFQSLCQVLIAITKSLLSYRPAILQKVLLCIISRMHWMHLVGHKDNYTASQTGRKLKSLNDFDLELALEGLDALMCILLKVRVIISTNGVL